MHPKDEKNPSHKAAAERAQQFNLGWFANPIFGTGDYPAVMKDYITDKSRKLNLPPRLPTFSDEEKQKIKGFPNFCVFIRIYKNLTFLSPWYMYIYPCIIEKNMIIVRNINRMCSYDDHFTILQEVPIF